MTDMTFDLQPEEIQRANDLYCEFGDKIEDKYQHLSLSMKRNAACLTLGVVRKMTPHDLREWSDCDDFRNSADALIMAYEIMHPEKLGADFAAADFLVDLAGQLDHSKCNHDDGDDDIETRVEFHDTSERMTIPDADVESKFEDILAGFGDTADEPTARATRFEVGTDGETTDTRDDQS